MIKKIKAKAVIFDRDGVIVNTEGIVIESVKKAFLHLGFEFKDEDIPQIIGRSSTVYTNYFLQKWEFDVEEYRKIQRAIFYENINSAPYFEKTVALIRSLHNKKIPLALTTSAGKEGTLLILKNIGLDNIFDVIITREDCKNFKPDPEPYIITAKNLAIAPEDCIVIEDTALGVDAAKEAGMKCIAIPNEYIKDQDFSRADKVVSSADEVMSFVNLH